MYKYVNAARNAERNYWFIGPNTICRRDRFVCPKKNTGAIGLSTLKPIPKAMGPTDLRPKPDSRPRATRRKTYRRWSESDEFPRTSKSQ